jgi:hypothetical protein
MGLASRDHAQAVKNYAEEEQARIGAELMKRTIEARTRQENAKADQEETRARMLRTEELHGRLKLFDEFQKCNAVPVWDREGNVQIVKVPKDFDWDENRNRLLSANEVIIATVGTSETESDE